MSWLRRDARNRAWRSLLQGLALTLLLPAADAALQALQRALSDGAAVDWRRVATTAGYAALSGATMSALAYLHRAKLDPSPVPSALPPAPPAPSPMPYTAVQLVDWRRAATSRNRWRAGFLAVTALAIVMELVAALDGAPETEPWTGLIVDYVPWPVAAVAFGVLSLWLPIHFWRRYRR